ncbi:SDR family NAD(P)-dependent oxidoreductase [Streptomyces sp. NPDC004237]|uniref:SDR family NAD(P)-dependent oxidoreductase n=1 Tax=Streptomyces sp. NPDC004237 TaxID=3154455 RepID=UPI0033B4B867
MRTFVVTGGTDGMGRGLGLHYLGRGDRVIAVGSSQGKGDLFLAAAADIGAAERANFVRADLSTTAGVRKLIDQLPDVIDVLVLAAQRFRGERVETEDGLESSFALGYLSRYLLGHDLFDRLERAEAPLVLNIAAPGAPGKMQFDDLQLRKSYSGMRVSTQTARRNDLLGVSFTQVHPDARTRYVLYAPGLVATGIGDAMKQPMRTLYKVLSRLFAAPVAKAIVPMIELIDNRPEAALTAFNRGKPLPLDGPAFDPADAERLQKTTADLVASISR